MRELKWIEIPTNDNDPNINTENQKYKIRTFIASCVGGYMFKQQMGITCLGITHIKTHSDWNS